MAGDEKAAALEPPPSPKGRAARACAIIYPSGSRGQQQDAGGQIAHCRDPRSTNHVRVSPRASSRRLLLAHCSKQLWWQLSTDLVNHLPDHQLPDSVRVERVWQRTHMPARSPQLGRHTRCNPSAAASVTSCCQRPAPCRQFRQGRLARRDRGAVHGASVRSFHAEHLCRAAARDAWIPCDRAQRVWHGFKVRRAVCRCTAR